MEMTQDATFWKMGDCLCRGNRVCAAARPCPALGGPRDCSPPGSSVHGLLRMRTLEWVAISSSRASSQPGNRTREPPVLAGRFFEPTYLGVRACQLSAERRGVLLLLVTHRHCVGMRPPNTLGRWYGFPSSSCRDCQVHGSADPLSLGECRPLCEAHFVPILQYKIKNVHWNILLLLLLNC